MLKWAALTLLGTLAACSAPMTERLASSPPPLEAGVSQELAQWRAALISDVEYDLSLMIPDDEAEPVAADMVARFRLREVSGDVPLDFREAGDRIQLLRVNGVEVAIRHEAEHVILPAELLRGGVNRVEMSFLAGDSSLNRNPDYLYTLFVPDRARTAFPLFDQPDLKASYRLTLDLPVGWKALANAPLEERVERGDRAVHRFAQSDPVASYLVSFVAGEFESVTRTVGGREMTMLHRQSDTEKFARNVDAIFELHGEALAWMEEYTGIPYPFAKFDFAAIPSFQYGGMEHPGAIQYRADTLFLDEDPSQPQLLDRANLIAHETAHMWFGDLVTMRWFDDVWTKEVFANFMAAKIVNPSFHEIDHNLNFLLRSYPAAYSVDRTQGANAIRQPLGNLDRAGSLYGAIIYNKAPIMMQQLELILGEEAFREGMREYLARFANGNASWPELIAILDTQTSQDLQAWSTVWVETPGRPQFKLAESGDTLVQLDPEGDGRVWPQRFAVSDGAHHAEVLADSTLIALPLAGNLLFNSDGMGYGLFPADPALVAQRWGELSDLERGAQLVNLYEAMLEGDTAISPEAYFDFLFTRAVREDNELLIQEMIGQMSSIYWRLLDEPARLARAPRIETALWQLVAERTLPVSMRKLAMRALQGFALTPPTLLRLESIWAGEESLPGISLSEREKTSLAESLALRMPEKAGTILDQQALRIENPDEQRRFSFVRPALSPEPQVRDAFFASLACEENRAVESWVLDALGYLHHPLRTDHSQSYVLPSLELLEEIRRTGDIFFPAGWIGTTLRSHTDPAVAETIRTFLAKRPEYDPQLRMKILQAADPLFSAVRLRRQPSSEQ